MIRYFDHNLMTLIEEYQCQPGTVIPRVDEWVSIKGGLYEVYKIIHQIDIDKGIIVIYLK